MDVSLQKQIFVSFFRAGIFSYGGGPAAIPLIHKEVVKTYEWMDEEEFHDVVALSNTLPGPMNTKLAGYLGYHIGGTVGLINAIVATVLPTVLLMIFLIGFLASMRDHPIVSGMTQAVSPVVGVLLLVLTYSFFKQSQFQLGWKDTIVIGLISFMVLEWVQLHPGILIAILLLFGFFSVKKRPVEHYAENERRSER